MKTIISSHFSSPLGTMELWTLGDKLILCDWCGPKLDAKKKRILSLVGECTVQVGETVAMLKAKRQLDEYFGGKRREFDIDVEFYGTDFQKKVWNCLMGIPYSSTISYKEEARRIGSPNAQRAVAQANGANALCIVVPCHRVVGSGGDIGGFSSGVDIKRSLLAREEVFHKVDFALSSDGGPFTNPFAYVATPECQEAAAIVRGHIAECHPEWADELSRGKMLGVLVCANSQGEKGFLAAFSGTLGGRLWHEWFVPPVLDYEQEDGVFKTEERAISDLNKLIFARETDPNLANLRNLLQEVKARAEKEVADAKRAYQQNRELRRQLREQNPAMADELDRQSQHEKAEIKRLARRHDERISQIEAQINAYVSETKLLKQQRIRRSNILQRWLFSRMKLHLADGTTASVHDIFLRGTHTVPPSGSGECCAPRLLNYAFANRLRPMSMAEFWVGASPKGEIRIDGQFYPACQPKCAPILKRMLAGSSFEPDYAQSPFAHKPFDGKEVVEILFEDQWIMAVCKPAGLITVSDNPQADSLCRRVLAIRPGITGPGYVHRLDQPTSGIVLFAKTKEAHQQMQSLFESRNVRKTYVAILEGEPKSQSGIISLPLRPNPDDRPRQMVDFVAGKRAVTRYEVVEVEEDGDGPHAKVYFHPETGRTHQLRVHAASPMGLGCPIVGDNLYGHLDRRLMLHAESIEFRHPFTGEVVKLSAPVGDWD